VTAAPITTRHGELTGGYFPLRYDGDLDTRADGFDDAQALALMKNGMGMSAKTAQGTSQARVQGVKMRPLLTLSVMSKVAQETVHDLAFREAVMDSMRLIKNAEVAQAIQNAAGMNGWRALKQRIGEIAAPPHEPGGFLAGAANVARRNTVTALMSGAGTAVQNLTGLIPALTRVHSGLLLKEVAQPHLLAEKYRDTVERSPYMRERFGAFERDLVKEVQQMGMQARIGPDPAVWFAMMAWVDRGVSVPVWQAAHTEALAKFGGDDAKAVAYADHIVRQTQGGGRMIDRAKIQNGNALSQLFTMFYSYFNGQLNQLVRAGILSAGEVTTNPVRAASRMAASALLVWVLPAVVSELTRKAPEDEDDEDRDARVLRSVVLYPAAMIPLLRDAAPWAYDTATGGRAFDMRFSPAFSAAEGVGRAAISVGDAIDGAADEKDVKAMLMGAGFAFNLPGKLMSDMVLGTHGYTTGKTDDIRAPLIGMPPTGR
jgi:hypothetical protein